MSGEGEKNFLQSEAGKFESDIYVWGTTQCGV